MAKNTDRPKTRKRSSAQRTNVGLLFEVMPGPLARVTYVNETRRILEKRERRVKKLRRDTRRELLGVLEEIESDVNTRIERLRSATLDKAKSTAVGQTVVEIPNRVTSLVDRLLGEVGLVRKAKVQAAPPRPRAVPHRKKKTAKAA